MACALTHRSPVRTAADDDFELNGKVYKILTANNRKCYLSYFNKIIEEYNNTYHRFVGEKSIDADYSVLTEEIESGLKAPKLKVDDIIKMTKYKKIFIRSYAKNWSRKTFVIDSALKTNPWTYKTKYLNGETIIGSFYEKELLLSKL